MSEALVKKALEEHLDTFTVAELAGPIVQANTEHSPSVRPYLRAAFIPTGQGRITQANSIRAIGGLYQISIVEDRSVGAIRTGRIAAALIAHFNQDLQLFYNGGVVTILEPGLESPPLYEDQEMVTPVTFRYRSYVST